MIDWSYDFGWDEQYGGHYFLDRDGYSPLPLEWNMKLLVAALRGDGCVPDGVPVNRGRSLLEEVRAPDRLQLQALRGSGIRRVVRLP